MVRAEQTDGRQPMTWSSVDWTATEAVVGRIQDRIFRAAKIKRPRLEPDDEQSSCPVLRGLGSGNGARLPDDRPPLRFGRRGPTGNEPSRPLRAKSPQERPRADLRGPSVARAAPLDPLRPRIAAGAARLPSGLPCRDARRGWSGDPPWSNPSVSVPSLPAPSSLLGQQPGKSPGRLCGLPG